MADNNVTIEQRYLSYNKADVERILGQVDHVDDTPTAESNNVVKSGGVATAVSNINDILEGKGDARANKHAFVSKTITGETPAIRKQAFNDFLDEIATFDRQTQMAEMQKHTGEIHVDIAGQFVVVNNYVRTWDQNRWIQMIQGDIRLEVSGTIDFANEYNMFWRSCDNGTFSPWIRMANMNDLTDKVYDITKDKIQGNGNGSNTGDTDTLYEAGKDPIFNLGNFGDDFGTYEEALTAMGAELNKLHETSSPKNHKYTDYRGVTRFIPIGFGHVALYGDIIYFLQSVHSYNDDRWGQMFFNADINANGKLIAGDSIVMRTCSGGVWSEYQKYSNQAEASEEAVRAIVTNWEPDVETEPGE